MTTYLARRILTAIPLLWGVLTLVFLIVQLAPGEPFSFEPGSGIRPGAGLPLRHAFGTDLPLGARYVAWLKGFLTGDLGVSFSYRQPVVDLIREAAGNTFWLAGLAILLQFLLGSFAGIVAAGSRSAGTDGFITGLAGLLYSIPSFWLGLVLAWLLSVRLGWFPASQMHSPDASSFGPWHSFLDALRHLVLPCLSLTLPAAAGISLYVRDEMRSALRREFIRSARARGLGEKTLALRHGFGCALLPLVNLLGLALPGLLGGSVVIEVLFAWPGMGRLAYQAVLARDAPLILGCTWISSILVVAGSLAADFLSALVDPRIREGVS